MSRNGSIEISPKYGVNPTIPICFWCGKEKNEIALMGRVRKKDTRNTAYGTRSTRVVDNDVEMPMHMVLNYEPCDCCMEQFSKGVQLIECNQRPVDERPALSKDENGNSVYPTGRHLVMIPEAAQRIFNVDTSMLEAGKKLCLDEETFNQLMSMMEQPTTNN